MTAPHKCIIVAFAVAGSATLGYLWYDQKKTIASLTERVNTLETRLR
jgi:hypothetical protein